MNLFAILPTLFPRGQPQSPDLSRTGHVGGGADQQPKEAVMAHYQGTHVDDSIIAQQYEDNLFTDFGLGKDLLIGGQFDDTFMLVVDEAMDRIDGSKGQDLIDYSRAD